MSKYDRIILLHLEDREYKIMEGASNICHHTTHRYTWSGQDALDRNLTIIYVSRFLLQVWSELAQYVIPASLALFLCLT